MKDNRTKRHLFLIAFGILILLSEISGFLSWIVVLKKIIQSEGRVGYVLFIVTYALTSVLLIPGTGMTLLGGLLFKPLIGIILSMTGAMIASVTAFFIARNAARDRVQKWIDKNEKYKKYKEYIDAHQTRFLIILRLIPVFPHVVMNYVFGLTRVSFFSYCFWTSLCLLPGTSLYVLIANSVSMNLMSGHIITALIVSIVVISLMIYLAW